MLIRAHRPPKFVIGLGLASPPYTAFFSGTLFRCVDEVLLQPRPPLTPAPSRLCAADVAASRGARVRVRRGRV
jgi:hypothetical protein